MNACSETIDSTKIELGINTKCGKNKLHSSKRGALSVFAVRGSVCKVGVISGGTSRKMKVEKTATARCLGYEVLWMRGYKTQ